MKNTVNKSLEAHNIFFIMIFPSHRGLRPSGRAYIQQTLKMSVRHRRVHQVQEFREYFCAHCKKEISTGFLYKIRYHRKKV